MQKILNSLFFEQTAKQWLFICLVISAAIGAGISYGNVYLFHIFLVLNVFYIGVLKINHLKEKVSYVLDKKNKMNYFFVFSIVWFLILLPFAASKYFALRHLIFITQGFLLCLIIVENVRDYTKFQFLFKGVSIIYIIALIIGVLEGLQILRWPISRISRYNHLFARENEIFDILSKTKYPEYVNSMPTGFHWNPNDFSIFVLLGLPFFLLCKNIYVSLIGLTTTVLLILAAGSKLAFLGVISIIIVSSIFMFKKYYKNILYLLFLVIFISTNGFTLLQGKFLKVNEMQGLVLPWMPLPTSPDKIIDDFDHLDSHSQGYRVMLLQEGIEMIKEHPLLGVGGGNSQYILQEKGGVGYDKLTNIHNFWFELLIEGGLIYFLTFVFWCWILLKFLFKYFKNDNLSEDKRYYISAFLLSSIGLLISGVASSSMIAFLPLYLFIGVLVSLYHIIKKDETTLSENFHTQENE